MKKENPDRREATEVSINTTETGLTTVVVDNLFELSTILLLIYVLIGGMQYWLP